MKYEYKGISEKYMSSLNTELDILVRQGWEPHGSITVAYASGGYGSLFALLLRRKIKDKES